MDSGTIAAIAGLIAGAAPAVAIVFEAMSEKKYLIACEYLQIDPAKVYDLEFIKKRIEFVRVQWSVSDGIENVEKLNKTLQWFEKDYISLTKKGFFNQDYANKFEKLVTKGKLKIHEGSVNETYAKCDLCQKNYEYYSRKNRAVYVICIVSAVICVLSAIIVVIFHFRHFF